MPYTFTLTGTGKVSLGAGYAAYICADILDLGQSRQLDFGTINNRQMEVGFLCLGTDIATGVDGMAGGTYWLPPMWLMFERQQFAVFHGNAAFVNWLYYKLTADVEVHLVVYDH